MLSTNNVPVTVKLVTVAVFQTVAVADPLSTILPVPKFNVLTPEPELLKIGVDRVNESNASVPAVNV